MERNSKIKYWVYVYIALNIVGTAILRKIEKYWSLNFHLYSKIYRPLKYVFVP